MIIRTADQRDIDDIVRIENACFSVPWSFDAIEQEICENKLAKFFIACDGEDNIVGYIGIWTLLDECQINKVAVLPEKRKLGIGKAILNHVLKLTRAQGIKSWYLEVRESNIAAQALYKSAGFSSVGIRKGYYATPVEDAVLMNLEEVDA